MYYFVNRAAAVVKPKEPFLNWVNSSLREMEVALTLDNIRIDCNSYLIPEVGEIEDGINFIDDKFAEIFALEFSTWVEDKAMWPQEPLTLKMFFEWFDVEICSTVIDISDIEEEDVAEETTVH